MGYLIWSNEHRAWWRPNGRGYTLHATKAGIYDFEKAKSICWKGRDGWFQDGEVPDEVMVPLEGVPEQFRPSTAEQKETRNERRRMGCNSPRPS